MKKLWKRNMVAGAVLLLVCGAIFLNGRYAQQVEETDKILGQATLVDGTEGDAEEVSGVALPGDYFATARLTRQQARDSALSLLQEASGAAEVDEAAAAEAAQSIQTLAAYTLAEAQIENMITAKGYTDCVVFMADDGVSVVVSAGRTSDRGHREDHRHRQAGDRADRRLHQNIRSKLAVVICGKGW